MHLNTFVTSISIATRGGGGREVTLASQVTIPEAFTTPDSLQSYTKVTLFKIFAANQN